MVVRVHGLFAAHGAAQHFDRAVRDHFVGVHVGLGAGASLPDDEGELVVVLAFHHLGGSIHDGRADFLVEYAKLNVHCGGRALQCAQRVDERLGHGLATDLEIIEAASCLRAPVFIGRYLYRTNSIMFCSETHMNKYVFASNKFRVLCGLANH